LEQEPASYGIPLHQRLYGWNDELASDYIHSLIIDLPVHNIIATTGRRHSQNDIEDGQHRFVTVWRFLNNLFAYRRPETNLLFYYDEVPKCEESKNNVYCLTRDLPRFRYELDNRQITLKVASGLNDNHRSIVFDYTNRGRHLKEYDLLYAYVGDNAFMEFTKQICEEYGEQLFKKHFGYDWSSIETQKRKHIQHLLAVIGVLASKEITNDASKAKHLDVINGHHKNALHVLALPDENIPKSQVHKSLELITNIYDGLCDAKGMGYRKDFMSKTGGLLGSIMIHIKMNPEILSDASKSKHFIEYWIRVINKIRSIPYNKENHWYSEFHMAERGGANNVHGQVIIRRLIKLMEYVKDTFKIRY
jgi:hypothetical protein